MGHVKIRSLDTGRLLAAYGDNIPPEEHELPDGDVDHYQFPWRRRNQPPPAISPAPETERERHVAMLAAQPADVRKAYADYWRGKLDEMNSGKRTIYTGELLQITREIGMCTDAELLALQRNKFKVAAE